ARPGADLRGGDAPDRSGAGEARGQPHAAHGAAAGAGFTRLPLAPGDRSRHPAPRRLRVGCGLLHQPDGARGGGGVSAGVRMRILFASSEVAPFSKTGGLGDVAFALPRALAARGHEVLVLSPLYGCVDRERHGLSLAGEAVGGRVWVAPGQKPRFAFWESASHFDRPGIYGYGGDYPDNAARFVAFSKSLLPAARALGFQPEVVHLNDWQTAAATLFSEGIPTVLTIHNLGYQGLFPLDEARHLFGGAPLPAAWLHHGQLGLLKG